LQIAAIFEFGGAMLLGRVVTNTIAGGIADPTVFARQPEVSSIACRTLLKSLTACSLQEQHSA
jgi:phosphate/sulfate permease